MISTVQPISAGNALRLFIEPPASAVRWKILRKGSGAFSGHDDPAALVVYEGDERVVLDAAYLQNEVMAFYQPFYTADGASWTPGPVANGTPVASYQEASTDVLDLLRDRLEAGLKVEVDRGNLVNELGYLQVFRGAPSMDIDPKFPLVSCHLEAEDSAERAIGEDIAGDAFDVIGDQWIESEGWLANVRVTVIGWALNADGRNDLRKAIRRVIVANLPVFSAHGVEQVDLKAEDIDATSGEYQVPLFQVMCTFSCVAPYRLVTGVDPVREVVSVRTEP